MLGVVLVLLTMFLIGPIVVFLAGAVWSALFGWALSEHALPAEPDGAAQT